MRDVRNDSLMKSKFFSHSDCITGSFWSPLLILMLSVDLSPYAIIERLQVCKITFRFLQKIIEKFHRNEQKPANHDIAVQHFNRSDNKIFVQFHYDDDAITATTKIFTKPPRSEEEATFNVNEIDGYVSNPWAPQLSDLELFYLLQQLLKDEEKSVDSFHTRDAEMKEILEVRNAQTANPLLKFSIFDPLRNDLARKLRLQRVSLLK